MGLAQKNNTQLAGGYGAAPISPLTATICQVVDRTGWSRSEIYRLLAAGHLRAVKQGTKTLIIWQTVLAHHATLPAATFGNTAND